LSGGGIGDDAKMRIAAAVVDEEQQNDREDRRRRNGHHRNNSVAASLWNCLVGNGAYHRPPEVGGAGRTTVVGDDGERVDYEGEVEEAGAGVSSPLMNSVSRLDKMARCMFPIAFVAFHVFYWSIYANGFSLTTPLTGIQPQAL
jgi:hypothetical protein